VILTVCACSAFPALSTEKNLIVSGWRRMSGVWYTLLAVLGADPPSV
jgi:hypothetical protein